MTPRNTVAIIQGRMASSRLPGKILLDIAGKPMLAHVVERARRAKTVDQVVVATTTQLEDDAVEAYCRKHGIAVFRGSLNDVLDRFYQAALAFRADVIVRLTADCPLVDPQLLDQVVEEFLRAGVDFCCNRLPPPLKRTYPIGLDVEVCTFQALERAWKEAKEPHEREHVMPYLYDCPGRFKILRVDYEKDYGEMRWTVDTPQDLELVCQIFARLGENHAFTWLDVLELFEREPQLALINSQVKHKTYLDVDERQKPA
ncbi:MAG: glycosyltransferase family protein [Anaerolineaceae bacterium]